MKVVGSGEGEEEGVIEVVVFEKGGEGVLGFGVR